MLFKRLNDYRTLPTLPLISQQRFVFNLNNMKYNMRCGKVYMQFYRKLSCNKVGHRLIVACSGIDSDYSSLKKPSKMKCHAEKGAKWSGSGNN